MHVWQITSGQPSLSAHVLVIEGADCHGTRTTIDAVLHDEFGLEHTTLQVDHVDSGGDTQHCGEPHGPTHRSPGTPNISDTAVNAHGQGNHEL